MWALRAILISYVVCPAVNVLPRFVDLRAIFVLILSALSVLRVNTVLACRSPCLGFADHFLILHVVCPFIIWALRAVSNLLSLFALPFTFAI